MSRNKEHTHFVKLELSGWKWGLLGLLIGWLIFSQRETIVKYRNFSSEDITQCGPDEKEEEVQYTCSMHPEVHASEPSNCPVCGMKLVAMGMHSIGEHQHTISTPSHALSHPIHTVAVQSLPMHKHIQLDGFVQADQNQNLVITAEYPGRISSLMHLQAGSHIHANQKLGSIYSEELIAAQKEFFDATCFRVTDPNMFIAARKKLRRWSFAEEHLLALEEGGDAIKTFPIKSHYSGRIQDILIQPGAYVQVGTPIANIIQSEALWADLEVFQEDLDWLKVGDKVQLHSSMGMGHTVEARISFIDNWIDKDKGTARVRVLLPNQSRNWKVGQYVKGSAEVMKRETTVQIPQSAVLWTGKRAAVYVKEKGSHTSYRLQEIHLGQKLGNTYQVISGLQEGQMIVSEGVFQLDAAAQLNGNIHSLTLPEEKVHHTHKAHSDHKSHQKKHSHDGKVMEMQNSSHHLHNTP